MERHTGGAQRFGVLRPVLLAVHDHDVRCHRGDRGDVGIFRTADMGQIGLLAEAGAGHHLDAPREQGLGDGRNEANDSHRAVAVAAAWP